MKYIVSASDLYKKSKDILNSGMEYVEVSFFEADDDIPAGVHFDAAKPGLGGWLDFDQVDVCPDVKP